MANNLFDHELVWYSFKHLTASAFACYSQRIAQREHYLWYISISPPPRDYLVSELVRVHNGQPNDWAKAVDDYVQHLQDKYS